MNRWIVDFRVPIGIEAAQDLAHAFGPPSSLLDGASWAISFAVLVYTGWIGTVQVGLRPRLCGVAGGCLFIASVAFSLAVQLIVHPSASPFMESAADLFMAFFFSPVAFGAALLGVLAARLAGRAPRADASTGATPGATRA